MLTILGYAERLLVGSLVMTTAERFLTVKRNLLWRLLFFVICYFGANTVIYIGDPIAILLVLPVFLPGFLFCCEGTAQAKLTMGMIFFCLAISLGAVIDTWIFWAGDRLSNADSRVLLPLVSQAWQEQGYADIAAVPQDDIMILSIQAIGKLGIHSLLRLAVWAVIRLLNRKLLLSRPAELSPRIWRLVDILTLFPFVTVFAMVALQTYDMVLAADNSSLLPTMTVLPFAFLSSFGLLYAVSVLCRHEKLEQQQTLWQVRAGYYTVLEQSQTQVRRLRHDMANHLHTMDVLNNAGMRSYLRELLASPAMTGSLRVCDNDIVNAVITSKTAPLEEGGVHTEIEVEIQRELSVSDIDLCALFANALDNAIEACAKLPAERRFIRLRAVSDKGLLMLRLENAAADAPAQEGGRIVTSKKDRAAHGFGLASIRDIVEKYDGTMETEYADGVFTLICTMTAVAEAKNEHG